MVVALKNNQVLNDEFIRTVIEENSRLDELPAQLVTRLEKAFDFLEDTT